MDVTAYEGVIKRDLDDPDLFADITTIPYTGYYLDDIGYVLTFDGTLNQDQVAWVQERVTTTPDEETIRHTVRQAMVELRPVRDGTGSMTTLQLSEAVRDLARGYVAVARLALPDLNGTN